MPDPAVGQQVRADDRGRVGPDAAARDVERGDRADQRNAVDRPQLREHLLVEGDRPDRRQQLVAGDHLGQPGARRRSGVAGDAADRHDHREPRRQRPDRQRRPAPIAGQRGPRQPLLEPEEPAERQAGDRREAAQHEWRDEHHDQQQQRVDGERAQAARADATLWPGEQAGHADGEEHADQPAQTRPAAPTTGRAGP